MSVIGYRRNIPTKLLSWRGVEINEQLALRNSLNALCYQTNYANFVFPTMFEINEQLSRNNSFNAFCYRLNRVNWIFSPELASVCLGTGHKMAINNRC